MHQRKSKKILIYFFILILVGSINNIKFNLVNLNKINQIKISGLNNLESNNIFEKINNLNLKSIFFLKRKDLVNILKSNTLVENYEIFKIYPSSLKINITKTNFLAKINNNGKIYLVGSNGKLSKNNFSGEKLPFIFGKPSVIEFLKFKDEIDLSKVPYDQIKNIFFFPSKRWDLELKNGILLKLPINNITASLDYILKLLSNKNLRNIKIVDARIENQIILNE